MKKILAVFVLILPHLLFAQTDTRPKDDETLAKQFVAAIQSKDVTNMLALAPTPTIFRITAPEETQGKTDAEIQELAKPMMDKMQEDYTAIITEAARKKIDLNKIVYRKQKASGIPYAGKGFYGMEIFFTYKKKKGSFTVGFTVINDIYYAYEIEKTVSVFKGM